MVSGKRAKDTYGIILLTVIVKGYFDSCWQLAGSVFGRSIRLIGYGRVRVNPLFPGEKWVRRLDRSDSPESGRPGGS